MRSLDVDVIRRLGILEGPYCNGACNLQPWDTAVNNLKASCNKRSTGSSAANPYGGAQTRAIANPTYTVPADHGKGPTKRGTSTTDA